MSPRAIQLFWGCDPSRQLESHWLRFLLADWVLEEHVVHGVLPLQWPARQEDSFCILVESGLLRLGRNPDPLLLEKQRHERARRINALASQGPFVLIHLSDEEGFDGDELYPMLPQTTVVWRNFPHPRFSSLDPVIEAFPIGPRDRFLEVFSPKASRLRSYPWAFMGTIWGSGSRRLATSLFLRSLPHGFFHGGTHFGVGLPLNQYQAVLAESVFALCPEGDRHLDTFRLYESLQMGCVPLVVDVRSEGIPLLGEGYPLPLFESWPDALAFARDRLTRENDLDRLQQDVTHWWRQRCINLSTLITQSLQVCA